MGMKMDLACLALFQRAASESHEVPFRAETPTPAEPDLARPGKEKRMLVLD